MVELTIPYVTYYSEDKDQVDPVKFYPMIHVDILKIGATMYSKIYKACMNVSGKFSNKYKTNISVRPCYFSNGKYYDNQERLTPVEILEVLGEIKMAFLFPDGLDKSKIDVIIKKFNLSDNG